MQICIQNCQDSPETELQADRRACNQASNPLLSCMLCLRRVVRGRWMEGAIVSEHWSTWMTQPVSTLARINSHGYHLLGKQPQQHIRSNKLTSISGKICALFHPSGLLPTSINLFARFRLLSDCSTFHPSCMFSFHSTTVSPLRPPLPYSNIFTLCILLFPSIYFRISPYLSSSPSLTVSFLHFSQLLQLDVCKLFPGDRVLSSVLQGTTSNSSWVCTHPHRPTRRLMSRLSKTAPRLNIDHQASVPRTLREAICQGDNLFCSTRYGVPGTQLFFLLVVSGPDRHHYRSKSGSLCVPWNTRSCNSLRISHKEQKKTFILLCSQGSGNLAKKCVARFQTPHACAKTFYLWCPAKL